MGNGGGRSRRILREKQRRCKKATQVFLEGQRAKWWVLWRIKMREPRKPNSNKMGLRRKHRREKQGCDGLEKLRGAGRVGEK